MLMIDVENFLKFSGKQEEDRLLFLSVPGKS